MVVCYLACSGSYQSSPVSISGVESGEYAASGRIESGDSSPTLITGSSASSCLVGLLCLVGSSVLGFLCLAVLLCLLLLALHYRDDN